MPHIQVGDVTPRIQFVGTGAQTAFTYPFPIFAAGDLEVWLGAVLQSSGYAVAGVGSSNGGTVTLTPAPSNGVVVTLRRRIDIQRTSDFQADGVIRADVLNSELDYQTMAIQQAAEDAGRAVKRAVTSASTADLTLPEPSSGKAIKWNSAGTGLENSVTDADQVLAAATAQANAAAASSAASSISQAAASTSAAAASTARAACDAATATTAADRAAVAADTATVAADKAIVATDKTATHADRLAADADAAATAADRTAVATDKAACDADATATAADRSAVAADMAATHADRLAADAAAAAALASEVAAAPPVRLPPAPPPRAARSRSAPPTPPATIWVRPWWPEAISP
ncbi:MAG: hypothetical protein EPN20_16545 [Magnetospirillum sp.]|nr:MAG: hypothetical protein EPN20_16545 [Magnetospirillum sp.]